ncbi:MAG: Gmad2 immunoglobulin-like domain-containing protein [Candidatus Saccharimonas sp.]
MKRTSIGVIVALSLIIITLLVWVAYLVWSPGTKPKPEKVTSFETCAAAGYPVMESYPRQCRDSKTGVLYVERTGDVSTAVPTTRSFSSTKGVAIEINNWTDDIQLASPTTITGKVPGSWSFEASFPVALKDGAGNTIAQGPATLQGDWMTDALVPFTVTLQFTKPATTAIGSLVLHKDNPSGLATNDDSLTLIVHFK